MSDLTLQEFVLQSAAIHPEWTPEEHREFIEWERPEEPPTLAEIAGWLRCPSGHVWVAGMCYVADEDVSEVAKSRSVECERCETKYAER